jgi:hypothetical protein
MSNYGMYGEGFKALLLLDQFVLKKKKSQSFLFDCDHEMHRP